MQWREWSRVKYKMSFYFSLTSTSFLFVESIGRRCASVLKTQCSSGRRSSSENIKYKYLERETRVYEAQETVRQWQHKDTATSPLILWRITDSREELQNPEAIQSLLWNEEAALCLGVSVGKPTEESPGIRHTMTGNTGTSIAMHGERPLEAVRLAIIWLCSW